MGVGSVKKTEVRLKSDGEAPLRPSGQRSAFQADGVGAQSWMK